PATSGAQSVVPMLAVMYARLPVPTARPSYVLPSLAGSRLREGSTSGAPWHTCQSGGTPVGRVPGGPVVPIVGVPSSEGSSMQRVALPGGEPPASAGGGEEPASTGGGAVPASQATTVTIALAVD